MQSPFHWRPKTFACMKLIQFNAERDLLLEGKAFPSPFFISKLTFSFDQSYKNTSKRRKIN